MTAQQLLALRHPVTEPAPVDGRHMASVASDARVLLRVERLPPGVWCWVASFSQTLDGVHTADTTTWPPVMHARARGHLEQALRGVGVPEQDVSNIMLHCMILTRPLTNSEVLRLSSPRPREGVIPLRDWGAPPRPHQPR
ncbi:MAG: hypothetical protein ACYCT1_08245 [Steroidobacteraceae bacterium]